MENTKFNKLHNTESAASKLNISANTLTTWRSRGGGPKYVKIGRTVRYPDEYLDEFAEAGTRTSTSDTGESV